MVDRMRLSRRSFLVSAGAAGLGLVGAACVRPSPAAPPPALSPATITFAGPRFIIETAGYRFVAQELGYYDQLAITPEFLGMADSIAILNAKLSGEADIGEGGPGPPLAAMERGAPLRLIGGSRPGLTFVVLSKPEIESLQDLEGRVVGSGPPGDVLDSVLQALFREEGVDASAVTMVNIGTTPDVYRALVAGTVDAGLSTIGGSATAESDGLKVLAEPWRMLPNWVLNCFHASEAAIQEKGDAIARAMAAGVRAHQFLMEDPAARELYVRVCMEEFGAPQEQAELSFEFMRESGTTLSTDLSLTEEQVNFMQEVNIAGGSQTEVLPYDEVVDRALMQQAQEYLATLA